MESLNMSMRQQLNQTENISQRRPTVLYSEWWGHPRKTHTTRQAVLKIYLMYIITFGYVPQQKIQTLTENTSTHFLKPHGQIKPRLNATNFPNVPYAKIQDQNVTFFLSFIPHNNPHWKHILQMYFLSFLHVSVFKKKYFIW